MKLRVIKSPEHKLLNCIVVWGGKSNCGRQEKRENDKNILGTQ